VPATLREKVWLNRQFPGGHSVRQKYYCNSYQQFRLAARSVKLSRC
jgi:hypothetical protein